MKPYFNRSTIMAGWCVCENGKPLPTIEARIFKSRNAARINAKWYKDAGLIVTIDRVKLQKEAYGA